MITGIETTLVALLGLVLKHEDWLMALAAHAYFDESGTGDELPDLCLAGYVFEKDAALAFDVAWQQMLARHGLAFFHMKECVHKGAGPAGFGPLSMPERDIAARDAIALIKAHAARGITISLDKSAANEMCNRGIWENPYAFVTGQTMYGIRAWADAVKLEGTVAYVFESGATGWFQAQEAVRRVMGMSDIALRNSFRIDSFTQSSKTSALPLQAADMLAWHWRKHLDRLRKGIPPAPEWLSPL